MKKIFIILISIFLLVLDNSLLPNYQIMGSYPSLLFIFAIAFCLPLFHSDFGIMLQFSDAKWRLSPGAILNAYKHASINNVPEPQQGS